MLPRFKGLVVLTFVVLTLYVVVFWRDTPFTSGQHAVDVLKGTFGDFEVPWHDPDATSSQEPAAESTKLPDATDGLKGIQVEPTLTKPHVAPTYFSFLPSEPEATETAELEDPSTETAIEPSEASHVAIPGNDYSSGSLQVQFDREYDALALDGKAGAIYGSTLKDLVDVGAHEGFAAAAIKPSKSWSENSDTPPYTYNPYPDYNSKTWQAGNQGVYKQCMGPNGPIADLMVYSGHPKGFSSPQMGSYIPLDIDSNLCFERETRLGPYGYQTEKATEPTPELQPPNPQTAASEEFEERDAAVLDWGRLQQICYKLNANRYTHPQPKRPLTAVGNANSTERLDKISKIRPSSMARRLDTILKRVLVLRQGANKDELDLQPGNDGFNSGVLKGDTSDVGPGSGELPGDYLKQDSPIFTPEQFDDVSPFFGVKGAESVQETSEEDGTKTLDWGEQNGVDLHNPASEASDPDDAPIKEPPNPNDFPLSDLGDDKSMTEDPQYDISKLPLSSEDDGSQDKGKKPLEVPGSVEDIPNTQGLSEDEAKLKGLHGMPPKVTINPTPRTAVVIRTYSHLNFTENDRQNIRAMVSELSLRSGSEYQVFLLVEWKDETVPILSDKALYKEALEQSVPKEFETMTVLWSNAKMREIYPLIPREVNNVHQSQWLSVQWFAQEHPEFDFYWNWEFDTRYTGHYYNLLEKLATFAKAQPRKGLWERNERYYIPSYHGRYSQFIKTVQGLVGKDTVWGAPSVVNVSYMADYPPLNDPKDDKYVWGVGEDADYISLSPMFNPVNTSWPGRNDVWGYDGLSTPRRATIGTQSRCSKKLLDHMHGENKKGNHVSSEMTPQTVSLLHGLKAVYAPIPMFFDRPWAGVSLQRYFNPGIKGQSGGVEESPFSWGREIRFEGSTWYYRATSPQRLYNNWLGWEDAGIGGPEWEKSHGRICLPPLLLHPIKNVVQPPPGFSSISEPPY